MQTLLKHRSLLGQLAFMTRMQYGILCIISCLLGLTTLRITLIFVEVKQDMRIANLVHAYYQLLMFKT